MFEDKSKDKISVIKCPVFSIRLCVNKCVFFASQGVCSENTWCKVKVFGLKFDILRNCSQYDKNDNIIRYINCQTFVTLGIIPIRPMIFYGGHSDI